MLRQMEWVNEPPCTELAVEKEDARAGRLTLVGPRPGARVKGGLLAAMGTAMAATAWTFLKLPFPAPWKVIPLVMAATGGGMAALGVTAAVADVRVEVERGKGIRFRWHPRPLPERELFVALGEIAAYEVKTNVVKTGDGMSSFREVSVTTFRLMLVTRSGQAYAIEEFPLSSQAELRRDQIQRVLGRARGEGPARKKRSRPAA
jgi:hypothetical protein